MQQLRVLLIEDNEADARLVQEYVRASDDLSCRIQIASRLSEALAMLKDEVFDLVLADLGLPDSAGLPTATSLLAALKSAPLIVLTGATDHALAESAIQAGAQDYLPKNELGTELLARAIAYAIERARVQASVRESEQRFRAIFEHSPLAVVIANPGGKGLIAANQAFLDLLGYSRDEIDELTVADVTHPGDLAQDLAGIKEVTEGRSQNFVREKRLIRKDGQILWVNAAATVLRSSEGIPEQILVVQQDITAEKTAALELEAERQRLKSVMEAMPAFLYLQAPDHTIPFFNERFKETFGEPTSQTCYQLFHGAESACEVCQTLEVLETRAELVREWTDHRGRIFELRESPFRAVDGSESVLVVGTEITDLVQATVALRASEKRFRELADLLPEVLFECTLNGNLTYANQVAFERFAYSQQQFDEGLSVFQMLVPEHVDRARASIAELLAGKKARGSQYTAVRSTGEQFPITIHAAVVREEGHPVGLRGLIVDISEQVAAQQAIRESEARLRLLFESAPIGIGYHALDGTTLAINSTAISRLKGTREDYLGTNIANYYRDPEEVRRRFAHAINSDENRTYVDRVARQGRTLWYQRTYTAIRDDSGEPLGVQVLSNDITSLIEAQEALEMAEHIVRLSPVGMFIYRFEEPDRLVLIDGNQEAETFTGLSIESCRGMEYREIWPAAEEGGILQAYLEAYRTNTPYSSDDVYYEDDRWSGSYRVRAFRIPGDRLASSFEDITQQKATRQQLAQSEQLLHESERIARLGGWEYDVTTGKNRWTQGLYDIYGVDQDFDVSDLTSILSFFRAEDRDRIRGSFEASIESGEGFDIEAAFSTAQGHLLWIQLTAQPILEDGHVVRVRGYFQDITDRKASEAALRQSEENYRTIFESTSDTIMLHDSVSGRVLDVNEKVIEMFGYSVEEFVQLRVSEFSSQGPAYSDAEAQARIHAAAAGVPQMFEWHCRRKDGSLFWAEVSLKQTTLLGRSVVLAVVRDISERKQLEAQLRQSQKLESIGTLASGVAHEINNPLMGMINYAELISTRTQDSSLKEFAEGIKTEGDRVARIVRNLLSFSRQDQEPQSPARMSDIVRASLTLVGSLLRQSSIQIEIDVPEELPLLRCRSQQIQQVIINLVTNARDSLNAKYPEANADKTLRIRSHPLDRSADPWLRTTVEDLGLGIAQSIAERVFDPFFTTKSRDEGTGLGLSISYGIIRDHGGVLSLESKAGEFSRFHIDLPLPEDLN